MIPMLVTLAGDRDPESLGFAPIFVAAARRVGKIGFRVGKGIAKTAKARRALKKAAAVAKAARGTPAKKKVSPVTKNTILAQRSASRLPNVAIIGGVAALAGILVLTAGGRK